MKEKKVKITKPSDQIASKASEFAIFYCEFTQSDVNKIFDIPNHSKAEDHLKLHLKMKKATKEQSLIIQVYSRNISLVDDINASSWQKDEMKKALWDDCKERLTKTNK